MLKLNFSDNPIWSLVPHRALRWNEAAPMRESLTIAAAFALWVSVYCVSFVGSAWHPTDYEHIPALTWRLVHGDVPYRDFIYHKPPGTLFLHSVWFLLPDAFQVRASRVFVYLEVAATTAVPVIWALWRKVLLFSWRLPFLAVATTAIALHNFPIMPWQTIDGLFFTSIAWVCLLEIHNCIHTCQLLEGDRFLGALLRALV